MRKYPKPSVKEVLVTLRECNAFRNVVACRVDRRTIEEAIARHVADILRSIFVDAHLSAERQQLMDDRDNCIAAVKRIKRIAPGMSAKLKEMIELIEKTLPRLKTDKPKQRRRKDLFDSLLTDLYGTLLRHTRMTQKAILLRALPPILTVTTMAYPNLLPRRGLVNLEGRFKRIAADRRRRGHLQRIAELVKGWAETAGKVERDRSRRKPHPVRVSREGTTAVH